MWNNLFRSSLLSDSLQLLSKRDQTRIVYVCLLQIALALLDLFSIALIGLTASLTLFGIQSKNPPEEIQKFVDFLGLEAFGFQSQIAILGAISGSFLVSKTFFSAILSRRILYFLNLKTAMVTSELLTKVLAKPYDYIKTRAPAEILYSLTRGVNSLVAGVIGVSSQIFAEISLLLVVFLGLSFFDPTVTVFCLFYFGIISYIQTRRLRKVAELSKNESTRALVDSESQVLESLYLYRELHVRGARAIRMDELVKTRSKMAEFQSRVAFMPYLTKYSIEIALVVGAILLTASQFLIKDAISALSLLSVFLVASSRVAPSLLRLQQGLIELKAHAGESMKTLELISELAETPLEEESLGRINANTRGEIRVEKVRFSYSDSSELAVRDISFDVKSGEMIAFVGPSGHGKSTILDLLMGALKPTSGSVTIDGLPPSEFIERFPGKIGYVAQESIFANASVRENLLLGLEYGSIDEEKIWSTLEKVGLRELFKSMPEKLDTSLGERGYRLSIGQKQRLSIARAILTNPKVVLFDEPTSALDVDSERLIMELIKSLRGETTIVVIAHRLETIQDADMVFSIEDGTIKDRRIANGFPH